MREIARAVAAKNVAVVAIAPKLNRVGESIFRGVMLRSFANLNFRVQ